METTQMQQLIQQGLAAMKTGSEMAAKATNDISNAAHNPKLKEALEKGNQTSKKWAERIDQALREAGGSEHRDNPVIEGIAKVNQTILETVSDADTRDLGIIAGGQLALHYWIAAFGTMSNYAGEAKLDQAQEDMKTCVKEAKKADEEHSEIAEEILSKK